MSPVGRIPEFLLYHPNPEDERRPSRRELRRRHNGEHTPPCADKHHPCQGRLRWRWHLCRLLAWIGKVGAAIEMAATAAQTKIDPYRDEANRT